MMAEALFEESKACVALQLVITIALLRKELIVSRSVTPLLGEGGEDDACILISARSSWDWNLQLLLMLWLGLLAVILISPRKP